MDNISEHILTLVKNNSAAKAVVDSLSPFGEVYVVGGAVRDSIMKKKPKDIDLVASVGEDTIQKVLNEYPNSKLRKTGKAFPVYRFIYQDEEVEIALPRKEIKVGEGNKDWKVDSSPDVSIEKDLERRDFTANAIAVNAKTGEIVDPFGGIQDIKNGTLKVLNENSFKDDSSRTLRALTAISKHGLQPDKKTKEQMKQHAEHINKVAPEILGQELDKMISGNYPHEAFRIGHETEVLKHFLPEVHDTFGFDQQNPHHKLDLGSHLMQVLKNMSERSNDSDMRIAALLHDIGKPSSMWVDDNNVGHFYKSKEGEGQNHEDVGAEMAEEILRRLRFPADRISRIKHLIKNHMFPPFNTSRGARRFLNQVGSYDTANDLLDLKESDHLGKGNENATRMMADKMRDLIDQEQNADSAFAPKDLAIDGNDIMKILGVDGGPLIGQIIKRLTDMVIDNPSINTKEGLAEIVKTLYKTSKNIKESVYSLGKTLTKIAAWDDVRIKAKRLKDSGNVTIENNFENAITGQVVGDTGTYNCEIARENPDSQRISWWRCSCPWGKYAWGRTRKYKKFEGRPCSHIMALYWQSLSTPVGYYGPQEIEYAPGQTQNADQTFSFEPDQPQYELTDQNIDQILKELEGEEEEPMVGSPVQPVPEQEAPEPPNFFTSKWKRIQ
jgi:tRNA nucleotidyltransferase (CCA-adding enzyme)